MSRGISDRGTTNAPGSAISSRSSTGRWRPSSSRRANRRRTGFPSAGPSRRTRSVTTSGCSRCSSADARRASSHAEQDHARSRQARRSSALGSGLRNLVGILDASSLVLAPDTGPLHMAVALDRPRDLAHGLHESETHRSRIATSTISSSTPTATRTRATRSAWRIASTECRASACATCSIASIGGAVPMRRRSADRSRSPGRARGRDARVG